MTEYYSTVTAGGNAPIRCKDEEVNRIVANLKRKHPRCDIIVREHEDRSRVLLIVDGSTGQARQTALV